MPKEIERKFLLANNDWKKLVYFTMNITQGYIFSEKGKVVRVRTVITNSLDNKQQSHAYITIKGPTKGFSRDEFEYAIPLDDANQMIKSLCKKVIIKTRSLVKHKKNIWEIDTFYGSNNGLVVAEIELKSEKQKFSIPTWLGKEVTDARKYSNNNLVNNPYSKWKKK